MASSSAVSTVDRGALGPIGASWRKLRFLHLATVLRFRPYLAASSLSGAFDRCIAARTAYVVVALPWSTWPISPPGVRTQLNDQTPRARTEPPAQRQGPRRVCPASPPSH